MQIQLRSFWLRLLSHYVGGRRLKLSPLRSLQAAWDLARNGHKRCAIVTLDDPPPDPAVIVQAMRDARHKPRGVDRRVLVGPETRAYYDRFWGAQDRADQALSEMRGGI